MPQTSGLLVRKADGSTEPFNPNKLRRSLRRAGASKKHIERIVTNVTTFCRDGITTQDIYREAFKELKKYESNATASRYSLKRALFELGPTGFPFEDFLSALMAATGFKTKTRQVKKGVCGTHELDLIATKGSRHIGAEAKFHNSPGLKSDLKVALYVAARFDDLEQQAYAKNNAPFTESWLITNTKFTKEALKYGECVGLTLISWSHPKQGNLQDLIEESGLHPITCLQSLSKSHKKQLLSQGLVLCRMIHNNRDALKAAGVSPSKIGRVLHEVQDICGVR